MSRHIRFVVPLAVVALAATACSDDSVERLRTSQSSGHPTPTASMYQQPTTAPSKTAGAPIERLRLTLDHDGGRFTVATTSNITLSLPDDYQWTLPAASGAEVVVTEELSDAPTGSRIWSVVARTAGEATLRTSGTPSCQGAGCPTANKTYLVTLDIIR